ncbi:MAG: MarR family transcriptional regulator [Deltaproteobacteria bacterium]|nr:MAG: MarR family transcriptional regulator [Deltaproteobacteria bacterium]
MNEIYLKENEELVGYQTSRLQDLINEIVQCCEDKRLYESQRFSVPYAELKCLMLFDGERYLTVKGIAQKLDVAKSRVTKLISGLIEKGLVERIDDPRDGRIKLINLTSAGKKKSEEVADFHREIHTSILLQMAPEERKNMLSYLESLRAAMEAAKEQFV